MNIQSVLQEKKEQLIRKQTENNILNKDIDRNAKQIDVCADKIKTCREALDFLEKLANTRRNTIKSKIETVLSEAVAMIYGANYSVVLSYAFKNNRSSMEIELIKKTSQGDIQRTMDGFGGGVSDCISVPLRLLVLLGSRQTDKVCVLDEAYKHVDPERIESVARFIKNIAEKLKIQIILLSHHDIMQGYAEKVYQIQDNNGKSSIKTQ